MKLNYFQFESQLARQLSSLYLISGDELLLKQDVIHLIRKSAKKSGFDERVRVYSDATEDQIFGLLNTTSLLSQKRLVEMDFRDHLPNKGVAKLLQEYAEQPSPDTILLIDTGKLDARQTKTAWIKSFESAGILVTLWPIPREQLPGWIIKRAQKYKLQIQPDAVQLLADFVEGNLIAAAQTLEKLYLLKPDSPVDKHLVQTLLTDESRFTVFDFIDNLIAGDKSRTLHILETLRDEGTEPVLILWGITRELRMLADYAKELQQGCTMNQLFQEQRIFARRQPLLRRFLTRFTVADCLHHLTHAARLDKIIKGAEVGNIWENLQLFCLRMA